MEKRTVKWGILGAGRIANRFASSLQNQKDSVLYALAARNPEKAEAFARTHGVSKVYTDFKELLKDREVDAVYIALPHILHTPWTIQALEAGKAVLCEKPAVCSQVEMLQIMATASENNVLFMEAMKTKFVPAYQALFDFLMSGGIGEITSIEAEYCVDFGKEQLEDSSQYFNQPGQGGVLLDGGCYAVTWFSDYLPFEMEVTSLEYELENGIDRYVKAEMDFQGKKASLYCAMDREGKRELVIHGSQGKVTVENLHRPQAFTVEKDGKTRRFAFPYEHDDFYSQIDAFVKNLMAGETENEVMPLVMSLQNARILDGLKSAIQGAEKKAKPLS